MSKYEEKKLCEDARKIQSILFQRGYSIKRWPNSEGKYNYYLVPPGKQPWEGAYICEAND